MADVDRGNCPSCNRPRAGSLESVGNSEFCWKTDVYCTQYERDTKPFRDRIRALESQLASALKVVEAADALTGPLIVVEFPALTMRDRHTYERLGELLSSFNTAREDLRKVTDG